MNSLTATRSMVEALVGMTWAIDAARNEISTSSFSALDELVNVLIRCRGKIEDAAASLEAAAEAASASRDATAIRRLRVRFRCLKLMATSWRGRLEEQRWRRCMARCCGDEVLSLRRFAATACHEAEKRVARLREPWVSVAGAAATEAADEAVAVDDAEGTALADFRPMADALMAIGSGGDAMEDSEEYQGILRGMERLFSSA